MEVPVRLLKTIIELIYAENDLVGLNPAKLSIENIEMTAYFAVLQQRKNLIASLTRTCFDSFKAFSLKSLEIENLSHLFALDNLFFKMFHAYSIFLCSTNVAWEMKSSSCDQKKWPMVVLGLATVEVQLWLKDCS